MIHDGTPPTRQPKRGEDDFPPEVQELRRLWKRAGITGKDLAHQLQTSQAAVSSVLTGDSKGPLLNRVRAFFESYQMPPAETPKNGSAPSEPHLETSLVKCLEALAASAANLEHARKNLREAELEYRLAVVNAAQVGVTINQHA